MGAGLLAAERMLLEFTAGFDASRITTAQAAGLLPHAVRIERAAGALTAALSARVAAAGAAGGPGPAGAVAELARQAGLSVGAAAERVQAGRRLAEQPEVARAAAAGELSPTQLAAVTGAAAADPTATGRLLEVATHASVGELAEECRRTRAAAVGDGEARRAAIHARRSLRTYTDSEGVGHLRWLDNPERIATVAAQLADTRDRLFVQARTDGRHERSEALDADALVTFVADAATHTCPTPAADGDPPDQAGAATGGRPRGRSGAAAAKLLVRIDFDTLLRGYPTTGEVCELAGYGPIAVSAVTDLLATTNPFLAAIVTRGVKVTGVAHLGRAPTAYQDSALQWAQPECAVLGCHRVRRLERDHREPWATSKVTLFDGLDRLCDQHHRHKTLHNWALVPGDGKREFVPPDDPRHPTWHPQPNPNDTPNGQTQQPAPARPPPPHPT